MAVVNSVYYKDIDTLFGAHPVTRKLNTLTNNQAVARAVKNLILTNKGERPYQPFLGSDVTYMLFELNDGTVELELKEAIELCIQNYEPRAELTFPGVVVNQNIDKHTVAVDITFRVVNQTEPITLNIILDRVR